MKSVISILSLVLFFQPIYSQQINELEKSLDSLKNIIDSYKQKTILIENEYSRIEKTLSQKRLEQTVGEFYICVIGTNIIKSPDKYEIVAHLSSNNKVKLLGQNDTHFNILYNNYTGWVPRAALISEKEFLENLKLKRDKEISDSINQDTEFKKNAQARLVEEKRLEKEREETNKKIEETNKLNRDLLAKRNAQAKIEEEKRLEKVRKEREETDKRIEEANKLRKDLLIQKYGNETGLKIYSEKIWIGMTSTMAEESIGKPSTINRTVFARGIHEQWVYDYSRLYLYFENGVLTSYQEEK
jgi:hypothetical protein